VAESQFAIQPTRATSNRDRRRQLRQPADDQSLSATVPQLKHYGLYLGFRLAAGLCGILPEAVVRHAGLVLGYLASFVSPARMRLAERHMRRVLGPDADTRRAARDLFAAYGRYWAELFWIRPRRVDAILAHTAIDGLPHLLDAHAAGKGMILVLAHTGNYEVSTMVATREGVRGIGVAESLSNRWITQWFVKTRNALGAEMVLAGEPGMRRLLEHLRSGQGVGIMADRDLFGTGAKVCFFGEDTTLPTGPVALAVRTGATLLPVATYFRPGRGHHVVIGPPLEVPDGGNRTDRIQRGTQLLATRLEDLIRAHPTQWHLLQPNWPSDR
jgi:phosphatidylinositol dimannoside acyltransferase